MTIIRVYLDDGRVYKYEVVDGVKAREHAHAIAMTGYRHTTKDGVMEHYPPHRILKIQCVGDMDTTYYDEAEGT